MTTNYLSYNKLIYIGLFAHFIIWIFTSVYGVLNYQVHIDDTIVALNSTEDVKYTREIKKTLF